MKKSVLFAILLFSMASARSACSDHVKDGYSLVTELTQEINGTPVTYHIGDLVGNINSKNMFEVVCLFKHDGGYNNDEIRVKDRQNIFTEPKDQFLPLKKKTIQAQVGEKLKRCQIELGKTRVRMGLKSYTIMSMDYHSRFYLRKARSTRKSVRLFDTFDIHRTEITISALECEQRGKRFEKRDNFYDVEDLNDHF